MTTACAVAIGCAGLAALVAVLGALLFLLQPTSYRITRSRTVTASPTEVLAVLSDPHGLERVDIRLGPADPRRVRTTGGPRGPGGWVESAGATGSTRLTITVATEALVELSSVTDGAAGATLRFELAPSPSGTAVTFAVTNEMHGLARAIWPFVGLERRLAPEMEGTLARLENAL